MYKKFSVKNNITFLLILISTISFSQEGSTTKTTQVTLPEDTFLLISVDQKPTLNGSENGFNEYLNKEFVFPEDVENEKKPVLIFVKFTITKKGKIEDVIILRKISESIDSEVMRVFNAMPTWEPAKHKGKKVNVIHTASIQLAP